MGVGARILGADLVGIVGGERQQEEPLRATPNTPPPSTTTPRGASRTRASTARPTHMEEEEASLGAGGSVPATNVGGEGIASQVGTDPPSMDHEDIDNVIEEVAKDAEAEATKIAAEEAAKSAAEGAARGLPGKPAAAEEPGKAAAGEAAAEPAEEEVANDQPSSPAAPAPGKYLRVGDDLFVCLPGTAVTRAPAEGEVFDDEALATAGLQALDHAGKVEKLELGQLKKEILAVTAERDTTNRTLADSHVTISDKSKLLSEANDSINDLKLKLDGLERTLSELRAREDTLNNTLEDERQLRKDDAAAHNEYVGSVNLWISRLVDVAGSITAQLAVMGMPDVRYSQVPNVSPNARLTLFFERGLDALEQLCSN
nr:uncharacterized protein LOC120973990 [Aegilops tauschii subsp. strangulata]